MERTHMVLHIKAIGKVLLCLLVSVVLAALATWYALRAPGDVITNGPWQTYLGGGSQAGGMYARARMAVSGLWGLRASETIYFVAHKDSGGKPLSHACNYRIEGSDTDSRWWSITPYESQGRFIANPGKRYSFSKTTAVRNPDNTWTLRLSRFEQPINWLPLSQKDGELTLVLRCYNPSITLLADPAAASLPRIVLEGCR